MKKHKDGNYYEKVITWKKKPDILQFVYAAFLFGIMAFSTTLSVIELLEKGAFWSCVWFLFSLILVIICGYFAWFYRGSGKKIKYRRIGK